MTRTADGPAVPQNNPCAQCSKPIASPVWTEICERSVSYVWVCPRCDYEFTQIATYRCEPAELEQRIAA
jgi:hypothetical protein